MIQFMAGYGTVTYMSNRKFTTAHFADSLFASQKQDNGSTFWLSHPYINEPVKDGLMTFLRLKQERCLGASLLRDVMETIALWLKKCLLMQPTTRKFGLQLLMATG
jgi:hypothetical protein